MTNMSFEGLVNKLKSVLATSQIRRLLLYLIFCSLFLRLEIGTRATSHCDCCKSVKFALWDTMYQFIIVPIACCVFLSLLLGELNARKEPT